MIMNKVSSSFLNNNDILFELYNELVKKLDSLPKLKIKTRDSYLKAIVFCHHKNFALISFLNDDGGLMKDSFRIIFQMDKELKNDRLKIVPEHQPNDYVYYVTINKKQDIDEEIIEWLKESYENAK